MKIRSILLLTLLMISCQKMFSQTDSKTRTFVSPPSDAPNGYTYDFNKAQTLILQRVTNPSAANVDAQAILNAKDFPLTQSEKEITEADKAKVKTWMENNPNIIITTFKNRNDIVHPF